MSNNLNFWYDEQIKRYLLQLIRVFSNFQVKEETNNGIHYNRVPARYGDSSRFVANILRNNSENTISSAPFIAVSIQSLQPARDRAQEPFLVDTQQVSERKYDSATNTYSSEQGNLYTTQRYMPVPYNLTIQVDVWTTNTDTKLQLLEQLLVLFNPSIQLQSNNNVLDWTNVFEVELTDINWSSRSIPQGVEEVLDIATLTFAVPIWISPPAKVKRQSIIQRIVADVHSVSDIDSLNIDADAYDFFGSLADDAEVIVTPADYFVDITGTIATLINRAGTPQAWSDLIEMQGELTDVSKIKLNISNDSDSDLNLVTGLISQDASDVTKLDFTLDSDTLPTSTLTPVIKIIDPRENYPGDGTLASAVDGARYLIVADLDSEGWPNWGVNAKANDIIQYNGTDWEVVFASTNHVGTEYVTNNYTSKQFKWDGTDWISSHEGVYNPGYWRLVL